VTLSAVIRAGTSIEAGPSLTISSLPRYIVASDPMNVSGVVSHGNSTARMTLWAVIDSDEAFILVIGGEIMVNVMFGHAFQPSSSKILPGDHKFIFYAVDEIGYISNGEHFSVALKQVPVRANWSSAMNFSFDVWGLAGSSRIGMTSGDRGFGVQMRTSGGSYVGPYLNGNETVTFRGATFTPYLAQLGDSAVLISSKMVSLSNVAVWVDLACHASLLVDGAENVSITSYGNLGYYISGPTYGFTIICGGHPLVVNASYTWFGPEPLGSYWTAETQANYTYNGRAVCSWSWRDFRIQGGGVVTRGIIIRSGRLDTIHPNLILIGAD
jgi:hypothetical protein